MIIAGFSAVLVASFEIITEGKERENKHERWRETKKE
jgi:hypothetical protein